MSRSRKRGQTIRGSAREIIAHVIQVCDEEAATKSFKLPLISKTKRAAMYTGVSETSIKNIRQESQDRNTQSRSDSLKSPGKKRFRRTVVTKIDDYHFQLIRRTIEEFYLYRKEVPSVRKLLQELKEKYDFKFGRTSLNSLLNSNGFTFRECSNNRKILMERPENVHWRLNYLKAIRKYRLENRPVVYLDETWIDNDMPDKICWQTEDHNIFGVMGGIHATGRLIALHAGSIDGFVKGAELVFQAGLSMEDCDGQLDHEKFENWLHNKLFPNILPESVIVLDNAPYHSVASDTPTEYSTKAHMVDWLQKKNIRHDPSARKSEIMEIINAHKPPEKTYKVDDIIRCHGHVPLRLPPFVCYLNPMELAWSSVKSYIREHNLTRDLSAKDLIKLVHEAISSITKENWEGYIKHAQEIESSYLNKDALMENIIDEIIINLEGKGNDEGDEFVSSSDDSDLDGDSDTELPEPKSKPSASSS